MHLVQRLALFDLDNTLVNLDEAFHLWAAEFVDEHGLDRKAVDWLIALDRAGYPHRDVFFAKVRLQQPWTVLDDRGLRDPTRATRSGSEDERGRPWTIVF